MEPGLRSRVFRFQCETERCAYRKLHPTGAKARIGRCLHSWEMCSNGVVTLPNIARNKPAGTLGSRRSDDFTPRLQGRCSEVSVCPC